MSLAQIKDAVTELTPRELADLTSFILERDGADAWDKQMEKDAASGKLDFLIEEAERAEREGKYSSPGGNRKPSSYITQPRFSESPALDGNHPEWTSRTACDSLSVDDSDRSTD